jgi:hypothetical protein
MMMMMMEWVIITLPLPTLSELRLTPLTHATKRRFKLRDAG